MASKKVVFIAFAIEDQNQRDLLKGQSLHTNSTFEYIDMSVKEPYDSGWEEKVKTRIRRSDGVIALVSKNSLTSTGEKKEIGWSKDEGKKMIGLWAYSDDSISLSALNGYSTITWTRDGIAKFIDSL